MCEHLQELDEYLMKSGVKETFRGQAWSDNCREWVYYDCVLDIEKLKAQFNFPPFIVLHENTDPKSGTEKGFFCEECLDGIMGLHPNSQ